MATRLYFHDTANDLSGTFPSGAQGRTPDWSVTGATTIRKMDTTAGSAQTSKTGSSTATTLAQYGLMGMFVSPPLAAGSVGGSSLTSTINIANAENNAAMDLGEDLRLDMYIWRPSTGANLGTLVTSASAYTGDAEAGAINSERVNHATRTGTPAAITLADGDVLIVEVWQRHAQTSGTSYTGTFYYDGATVNTTTNAVVTDHASFLELTYDLTFLDTGVDCALAVTFDAMTLAGDGTVAIVSDTSFTLGATTLSSDGAVAIVGDSAVTLGDLTLASTFAITTPGEFDGAILFDGMTLASAGAVAIVGDFATTLGDMTLASTFEAGFPERLAAADITFGAMTLAATVSVQVVATAAITLGAMTLLASSEEITGDGRMGLEAFVSAYNGDLGDKIHNFLLANTTGTTVTWTTPDLWLQFFTEKGYLTGTIHDRMREFLIDYTLSADTGQTIEDLWALIETPYIP